LINLLKLQYIMQKKIDDSLIEWVQWVPFDRFVDIEQIGESGISNYCHKTSIVEIFTR